MKKYIFIFGFLISACGALILTPPALASTMPTYANYTIVSGIAYSSPADYLTYTPDPIAYAPFNGVYDVYLSTGCTPSVPITDATEIYFFESSFTYSATFPLVNLGGGYYSIYFDNVDADLHGGAAYINFEWSGGEIGNNCSGPHPWPAASITFTPGAPILNFIYPTSSTTPIFPPDNFLLQASNVTATDTYNIHIIKYLVNNPSTSVRTNSDNISGDQLEHYGALVPNPIILNLNKSENSNIEVDASLYDITSGIGELSATSTVIYTEIPYSINGSSSVCPACTATSTQVILGGYSTTTPTGVYVLGTTNPFSPPNDTLSPSEISNLDCSKIAPTSILDVGGGLLYAGCKLVVPDIGIEDYFNGAYASTTAAFPFSIVFGLHTLFTTGITTGIASGSNTIGVTLPSDMPIAGGQTMIFISTSTLKNLIGINNFNNVFAVEDATIWLFMVFLMYEIVTH